MSHKLVIFFAVMTVLLELFLMETGYNVRMEFLSLSTDLTSEALTLVTVQVRCLRTMTKQGTQFSIAAQEVSPNFDHADTLHAVNQSLQVAAPKFMWETGFLGAVFNLCDISGRHAF